MRVFCRWISFWLAGQVGFASQGFSLDQVAETFPTAGFEDRIDFWKQVFTQYGERDVVLHDRDRACLLYDVLSFERSPRGSVREWRSQKRQIDRKQQQIRSLLDDLRRHGAEGEKRSAQHQELADLLRRCDCSLSAASLRSLRNNIHAQRGIKEKFRDGIVRSGRFLEKMESIFGKHDLPTELAALPHVESSFNYAVRSSAGAVGIWQFMRSTGRYYLKINRYIDERYDPIRSTEGAARLLKDNYRVLGNWPLAITAYNHGKNGMLRAKRRHGPDLLVIIDRYRSKYFGYAGKNFYAEFLSALEASKNYPKYFGALQLHAPLQTDNVLLDKGVHLGVLTQDAGLSRELIHSYNPQLTRRTMSRNILPAGLALRVPAGKGETVRAAVEKAPELGGAVTKRDDGTLIYEVQRGDTLSDIARQFGTSVRALQRPNGIRNPHRIRPGQHLVISSSSSSSITTDAIRSESKPSRYRVKKRDTLHKIACLYGVSVENLKEKNGIRNPNRIYLGQVLLIP